MKIFVCVRNREGDWGETPFGAGEQCFYEIPDSAICRSGNPFFVPDFDGKFTAWPSLAVRIGKLGKGVAPRFALRYVDAAGPALAVTATELLEALRGSGDPWTRATAFDRCLMLGNLEEVSPLLECNPIEYRFGAKTITYCLGTALREIADAVAMISEQNTIKTGDIILTGLAPDGFALHRGPRVEALARSREQKIIDIPVR